MKKKRSCVKKKRSGVKKIVQVRRVSYFLAMSP